MKPGDRMLLDSGDDRSWVTVAALLDRERAKVTFDSTNGGWMIVPRSLLTGGRKRR